MKFKSLNLREKVRLIIETKDFFENSLKEKLNLQKIPAPLFVSKDSGIQDNLNGVEKPVEFEISSIKGKRFQIVHSLAKWKRLALKKLDLAPGEGILTNMLALRPEENIYDTGYHSVFVDQWDWEKVIREEDRNLSFLKETVKKIYEVLKDSEKRFSKILNYSLSLPDKITFIHSEELFSKYPMLSPKEREREITKKHGAVFIIGIGYPLPDGKSHDGRAPDYDDWITETEKGYRGLNGDIIVWNSVLNDSFEISSMGIRVDKKALIEQLKIQGHEERLSLMWHKMLVENKLPLSIGGGIGQSRVSMFLLRAKHIGEVQPSEWPEKIIEIYEKRESVFL